MTDYILKELHPLQLNSSIESAKTFFKEFPFTHFPVVESEKLLGSFAENDISIIENENGTLVAYRHLLTSFFASENTTVLELVKIFADNGTNILPVLDDKKNYVGYYDLRDVLEVFASTPFMTQESEILTLKKLETDFSMSRIAQIVEANNGKLVGAYISEKKEDFVEITLKIITQDMNEIMQTFRRYDYEITSTHENDVYLEDLKNRSEYLLKYLEM